MPDDEDSASLLENAEVLRQRAARARRLASATTAPDVADALRDYAVRIERQVRELEERAAASIGNAPQATANETPRIADEPSANLAHDGATKPG